MICLVTSASCHRSGSLFNKINSSGINFNNRITENDSINPLDMEFLYNGGGVAAGDFNNDGLTDLYFTASQTSNKLYLNKGEFSFTDVTEKAGVSGSGRWANAASVVDINADGLDDIYVCNSIKKDPGSRKNLLYINQGVDKEGHPSFKDMAAEYHLDDTSFSVHAAFFDYDNDGDLDMYLVTTRLAKREARSFMNRNFGDTSGLDIDKLFRNDWNESLHHPVFVDVSAQAGITDHGYGLGVAIADINRDGWKDIYVTNDFFGSDVLYINNHDGTFSNQIRDYLKHTSQNAMGNDIADVNNDGLADILAVDMAAEDNFRKKKNMSGSNYFIYQNMMAGGRVLQYVRNTLQINQGPAVVENDSITHPVFSDVGFMAGVAETDWSWNPSIADFNNDGRRDIIITNGYPRDVTDHDFAAFMKRAGSEASKKEIIDQMPQIKIPNYAYRNDGDLHFKKITTEWGLGEPCFSTGAIYADLDNDGYLDYVINNINDKAFVYENTTNTAEKKSKNFLELSFNGGRMNTKGIGAIAEIYYRNGSVQVYENSPYRGYLSTVEAKAFFGLDSLAAVDSIVIEWPGKLRQVMKNVPVNRLIKVNISDAHPSAEPLTTQQNLFTDITSSSGIKYTHYEREVIDFNDQRLLPHKLSEYGPPIAAGDLDGNGFDDIVIGATVNYTARIFFQQPDGNFLSKEIPHESGPNARRPESADILIFDADNDADQDIYFANGSNEFVANTDDYRDRLYINDGAGELHLANNALPENKTSKSCVRAADFDNDGDLDLFVGGRVLPGKYPLPVNSSIYRNVSSNGHAKFEDVSKDVAPFLQNAGMICDAIWTDFDNDNWLDLVVVGEWMPVTFLKNNKGKLQNISPGTGINNNTGWWTSVAAGDFDNDGDIDYVAGNLGLNSFYRAGPAQPVRLYAKDFDQSQSIDLITSLYLPDQEGKMKEFPAQTRDDHVEQIPKLKKKFLTYKEFAMATMSDLLNTEDRKGAMVLSASYMQSAIIRNDGNGKFVMIALPRQAQVAPLNGMVVDDFNGDGYADIAISGNDYGTEVVTGRYDALNGLVLIGNGDCTFRPLTILQSGLYIPGNGKGLIRFRGNKNKYLLLASQNKGPLKVFQKKNITDVIKLNTTDKEVQYYYHNGKKRREEIYFGSSFDSQSPGYAVVSEQIDSISVRNNRNEKKIIYRKK